VSEYNVGQNHSNCSNGTKRYAICFSANLEANGMSLITKTLPGFYSMSFMLTSDRVNLKSKEYEGYPHYFWTFPAKCLSEPAQQYNDELVKGVEFVLS
jgi:hypothetical protein